MIGSLVLKLFWLLVAIRMSEHLCYMKTKIVYVKTVPTRRLRRERCRSLSCQSHDDDNEDDDDELMKLIFAHSARFAFKIADGHTALRPLNQFQIAGSVL